MMPECKSFPALRRKLYAPQALDVRQLPVFAIDCIRSPQYHSTFACIPTCSEPSELLSISRLFGKHALHCACSLIRHRQARAPLAATGAHIAMNALAALAATNAHVATAQVYLRYPLMFRKEKAFPEEM